MFEASSGTEVELVCDLAMSDSMLERIRRTKSKYAHRLSDHVSFSDIEFLQLLGQVSALSSSQGYVADPITVTRDVYHNVGKQTLDALVDEPVDRVDNATQLTLGDQSWMFSEDSFAAVNEFVSLVKEYAQGVVDDPKNGKAYKVRRRYAQQVKPEHSWNRDLYRNGGELNLAKEVDQKIVAKASYSKRVQSEAELCMPDTDIQAISEQLGLISNEDEVYKVRQSFTIYRDGQEYAVTFNAVISPDQQSKSKIILPGVNSSDPVYYNVEIEAKTYVNLEEAHKGVESLARELGIPAKKWDGPGNLSASKGLK